MKKLFFTASLLVASIFTFQSCIDDDINNDFTCPFYGIIDSINFNDLNDTTFSRCIVLALSSESFPISGNLSQFEITGKGSTIDLAIYNCINDAETKYEGIVKSSLENNVRNEISKYTGDTLNVDTLNSFTVHYGLYGYSWMYSNKWSSTGKPFSVTYNE